MRAKIRWVGIGLIALGAATFLFCRATDSPAKPDDKAHIWTDGEAGPPPVPAGFNPVSGFADLVEKLKPAVVNIYTTTVIPGRKLYRRQPAPFHDFFGDDFFRRFFGDMEIPPQKRNSLGSGFLITEDGYVLTNNHVVAEATEISVKLESGKEYKAKVVGRDEKYDLALLKIEAKERLPIVPFGDSDRLRVGDWVIAIGNPFGLSHTVTAGIVSAKDRVIGAGPFDDFIQTDASINPGNSGGPLFDTRGLVVGINTAIHAAGQGIGFAVPINMAKRFISDVLTRGRVSHGWLGVGIQELTPELASGLKLPTTSGVLVSQVFPDSPAEKAGFRRGDVIVAYEDRRVEHASDLTRLVGTTAPGTSVKVKVLRDGREKTLEATIAERSGEAEQAEEGAGPDLRPGGASLGIEVAPIGPEDARRFGLKPGQGVLVRGIDEDGPAAETGIRPGDVILEVQRQPVGSAEEFRRVVDGVASGDSVLLLLVRGPNYFYVVVRKP